MGISAQLPNSFAASGTEHPQGPSYKAQTLQGLPSLCIRAEGRVGSRELELTFQCQQAKYRSDWHQGIVNNRLD